MWGLARLGVDMEFVLEKDIFSIGKYNGE